MNIISFEVVQREFANLYNKLNTFFVIFFDPLIGPQTYDSFLELGIDPKIANSIINFLERSFLGDLTLAGLVLGGFAVFCLVQFVIWILQAIPIL